MTTLRSTLTLTVLLLASSGVALVASQAQQQSSLFYERQMNPTVLSGISAQLITGQTQAATTPAAAQSSSNQTPYTGGSTSSASASCANAIESGTIMSDADTKKIEEDRAQKEAMENMEKGIEEARLQAYKRNWTEKSNQKQQSIADKIYSLITCFPKEIARLIALYAYYEFNGICSATITDKYVWMLLPRMDGSLISWARKMPREKDSLKLWVPTADAKGMISWQCNTTLTNLILLPNGTLLSIPEDKVPSDCGSLMDCSGRYVADKRIAILRNGNCAWGCHDGSITISSPTTNSEGEYGGKANTTLKGHTDFVNTVVAWPDESLASGSSDKSIKIWAPIIGKDGETISWECTHTLKGHTDIVEALAILPNGDLVSASYDKTIKIWSPSINSDGTTSWQCSNTLPGHTNGVIWLTILSNGTLASASRDDTIKIWE